MCNLHFIRKRNRASCTYAVAGPEQLPNYEVKKNSARTGNIGFGWSFFMLHKEDSAFFLLENKTVKLWR